MEFYHVPSSQLYDLTALLALDKGVKGSIPGKTNLVMELI